MQGVNPYAYVNGNPETEGDPTGYYMGTSIPFSQQGGAIGYIVPGSDILYSEVNNGNYFGSITGVSGQNTPTSSNIDVHTQTLQAAADPYNPLTDANNSPLAKLSQAIGLPDLQQVWDDPNSTWQDKLGAIWNFAKTNANNAFQLAMIFGGGPEGDAEEVAAEEERALTDGLDTCGGGLSFAPATLVATSQGEQTIGTIRVGEKVWAYNAQVHTMELEPVLHVWINHDNDLVDLTLTTTPVSTHGKAATKTSETIHTNKKHPFLTKEKGFLPVSQITLGMHILRADGTYGVVTGWRVVPGTKVMYNLEVAQDHTFTVGVDRWVVHNCGGVDLNVEEANGGHTLSQHVDITEEDNFLRATVARGKDASAFYSEGSAAQAIQYMIDNMVPRVEGTARVFEGAFTRNIGYVFDRLGNRFETSLLRVVQVPFESGWRILTAYPIL